MMDRRLLCSDGFLEPKVISFSKSHQLLATFQVTPLPDRKKGMPWLGVTPVLEAKNGDEKKLTAAFR
jgi:hypothetical protein